MEHTKHGPERISQRGINVACVIWLGFLALMASAFACGDYGCGRGSLFLAGVIGGAMVIPAYFSVRVLAAFFPSFVTTKLLRNMEGIGTD